MTVKETVDATKTRFGRDAAVELARTKASKVVGVKATLDLKKDKPDDDALAELLLGPTGNLKAPTIFVGNTMIVGFNPVAYDEYLT